MKRLITIFFIIMAILVGCGKKHDTNLETYYNTGTNMDQISEYFMPQLEDLGDYEDIDFVYTWIQFYVFESNSLVLDVEYDEDLYEIRKKKIADEYDYFDPLEHKDTGSFDEKLPEVFEIGSYEFKIVKMPEGNHSGLPKQCAIVGTSDEKNRIAYLFFHDFDLDYVSYEDESTIMQEFIEEYFDYTFE